MVTSILGRRVPAALRRPVPASAARRRHEARFAWLLILPTVLGVGLFTAAPIIASFVLSLFNYSVISPPTWAGLANYTAILHDSVVQHAFVVTVGLAVGITVLQVASGLAAAIAVQPRARWARPLFRSAFFVPLLVSGASISILMSYIFDDRFGVLNYYLSLIGLPQVPWLSSTWGAVATIVIVVVWQQLGFTFIVFSAALGAVPKELTEAARVDGAGGWSVFRKVTLPMISPSILFTATVSIINQLQLFDQPYILTKGGPGFATQTVVQDVYEQAFQNLRFGYASAVSVALFVLVLIATYLQFRISRKWVFYS
jgi:multiple sugar transport system permease protein